jgi:uncharacterized membrane protein
MSATTRAQRSDWLVPAGLILLGVVPAIFGTVRLAELAGGAEITPANARFFAAPFPVVMHILAVIPYSIVGAFQFSRGIRRRSRRWHRAAGWVLAPLGMLAALTGLWMAHFYPWPEGDGEALYVIRLVVGVAMAVFIVLAVRAIRRRDYVSHGAWMTRAYAIGLGAGTQVLTHLPWFIYSAAKPGELPRAVMMGGGWAINIAVAEWVIRRRHARPSAVGASVPPATAAGSVHA